MSLTLSEEQALEILRRGEIEEKGLLPYSSNHSFLVLVHEGDWSIPAVYKPQRGENPLWDFEWGTLCKREAAAYVVSHGLRWDLVPPTVLREGTRGLGSVQIFVDHDSDAHYFTAAEDARYSDTFRRLALFDFVVNNADRKSGHCLVGSEERVWAIDHGICFHTEYKLRTVIWEFSCEPIEHPLLDDLHTLENSLADDGCILVRQLRALLSRQELAALRRRTDQLVRSGSYPAPMPQRRNYPWPPI
jgi:uncharacterized repeat protein (TIGR03843 family)